jgi:hypothetical protein
MAANFPPFLDMYQCGQSARRRKPPSLSNLRRNSMTTGNVLYLLMVIGMFISFSAVLGYQCWQHSRLGRETVPAPRKNQHPHGAVTA